MTIELHNSDCLDTLSFMPDNSVDALVTDPPAGISFMGKSWDHDKGGRKQWIAWMTEVMTECLRVMKPGAHGLVWAIPRTSHWTATALEDAGFEVRDVITHLFGSGFPKSLNISKAIDKASGVPVIINKGFNAAGTSSGLPSNGGSKFRSDHKEYIKPHGITYEAKQWEGWGTALKPASEHWILIRKPCSEKTVAANVLKHGVGGINVDGCRIEGGLLESDKRTSKSGAGLFGNGTRLARKEGEGRHNPQGRFPANLVLSHNPDCEDDQCSLGCAVSMLDEQSLAGGMHSAGKARPKQIHKGDFGVIKHGDRERLADNRFGDVGGASRFFYCAKTSTSERNAGLEGMPGKDTYSEDKPTPQRDHREQVLQQNHHPTVKAQKLMRYLCRLITPLNGVVLDPFMGSGSTGLAALSEGFRFIGIEKEQEYFEIAKTRINNR